MVDSAHALWLQSEERLTTIADAAQGAKWGGLAGTVTSPALYADEASAQAEGTRFLDFFRGPLVEDQAVIAEVLNVAAIRGRLITMSASNEPAYAGGAVVFVLGGDADRATGQTLLTVLRRL